MLRRRAALVTALIIAVLAAAALRDFTRLGPALPWRTMDEFADFYCAGAALDDRADPYTYEPLHSCEHRINTGSTFRGELFAQNPGVAVPAPQPAYDLLPFMALARLSAGVARALYAIAIVMAAIACAVLLAQLGIPFAVASAALILSTAYASLATAQIVPFALLALVLAGWSLARGRPAVAGVAAALTAIEPSIGAAAIVAIVLFVPAARAATVVTVAALAALNVALTGAHVTAAYLTSVLPAHAMAEARFPFQYSLTFLLTTLGAPASAARAFGTLSYLAMAIVSIMLARRVSARLARPELLVFVPALGVLLGGAFLHQEELAFAIPALLVICVSEHGRVRSIAAAALCFLSIPWIAVWGSKQLFLCSLLVCAVVLAGLRVARWSALATLAVVATLIYLFELHPPHLPLPTPPLIDIYAPGELVQHAWHDYVQRRSSSDPLWVAIKIPSWLALIASLALAYGLRARYPAASAASRES
jgi:hypothetical protein